MRLSLLTLFVSVAFFSMAGEHRCHSFSGTKGGEKPSLTAFHTYLESQYDVKFQHLDLNVELASTFVKGSVKTMATVLASQLDTFAFELHPNLTIDSILFQNQRIAFSSIGAERKAVLSAAVAQNQLVEIQVFYKGIPPTAVSAAIGAGFSNSSSGRWGNQVTWSLSQPFAAYEWWPCKQDLADKIDSSWCFITTSSTNKAASNGILTRVVNLGNGKSRYEWKSKHPIDYYLISVAVAEYVDYSFKTKLDGVVDSILVQNYVYNNPQTLPTFKADIDRTGEMLQLYSKLFGTYPFADEKYGHAMAPFSGGMEHQTMTSLGFFEFELIAHELAHQWFGDNVTCATWKDIFVNEGFASYSEYLAQEFLNSAANARTKMQDVHTEVLSAPDGAIWFTDSTNVARIFDSRLSYDKGSAIVHSIRYTVNNDSLFFLALQNYQRQKKGNVATAQDFKAVLETTTGIDFTDFFEQWFYGEGYPTFNVKWNADTNKLVVRITQTTSSNATSLFKTHLDLNVPRVGLSDTLYRIFTDQNTQTLYLPINGLAKGIGVDPANWILNKTNGISRDTTLEIANPNAISNISNSVALDIFPNPASSELRVSVSLVGESDFTIRLLDMNGKKTEVPILKTGDYQFKINTESVAGGLYLVQVLDQNSILKTKRVVVAH